jgi:hypothetical protein
VTRNTQGHLVIIYVLREEQVLTQTPQAKMHNNEPSRGAEIDKELQQEDEEELRKKGGR